MVPSASSIKIRISNPQATVFPNTSDLIMRADEEIMQTKIHFAPSGTKSALISAICLLTSGCSLLDIGEADYGCPGIPHGIKCQSARTVLDSLSEDDAKIFGKSEPSFRTAAFNDDESDNGRRGLSNDASGDADARFFESSILAPKALRVKVRPYTDIRGVRHGQQTLTVVIDKWTIRQEDF